MKLVLWLAGVTPLRRRVSCTFYGKSTKTTAQSRDFWCPDCRGGWFAGCIAMHYSVTQVLFLFLCKQVLFFIIGIMLQNSYLLEDRQAGRERPTAKTWPCFWYNYQLLCPKIIPFDRHKRKRSRLLCVRLPKILFFPSRVSGRSIGRTNAHPKFHGSSL